MKAVKCENSSGGGDVPTIGASGLKQRRLGLAVWHAPTCAPSAATDQRRRLQSPYIGTSVRIPNRLGPVGPSSKATIRLREPKFTDT